MKLNTVAELIADIREGRMVVLMDDENRENEGDLVMAATHCDADSINFMATYARGLICLTLVPERCEQLQLKMMVEQGSGAAMGTNFTVSIDAARGVTTGISANDRAETILAAVAADAAPEDIVQPGHIFPLRAEPGGVLTRAGHTEAGCDLARLAGLEPAAVIVEIMREDGTMARRPDLEKFAEHHRLKIGTIAELIEHRVLNERTVMPARNGTVKTQWGDFHLHSFRDLVFGDMHIALVRGELHPEDIIPVRVHVPELVRDSLGITGAGGSGWTVSRSMDYIARQDKGVLLLLGRQVNASEVDIAVARVLGQSSSDTAAPQNLTMMIGLGSQILRDLGVVRMNLLAQPARYVVSGYGLKVENYLNYSEVGNE